ncbi:hypothetical protein BG74_00565 [Sodalis-like endosymbiont of Proechinophthirus fluctus]|nr:hypothetical protein BG74_00565 [Sodalis-like endosymbiont of Proechinophthirus fluctus]
MLGIGASSGINWAMVPSHRSMTREAMNTMQRFTKPAADRTPWQVEGKIDVLVDVWRADSPQNIAV